MRFPILFLGLLALGCETSSADLATAGADGASPALAAMACAGLDGDSCLARGDCHATFEILDCDNLLGYCASFVACEDGPADCIGPASCDILEPSCPEPFVVSYTATCYGPCVRADQCAEP